MRIQVFVTISLPSRRIVTLLAWVTSGIPSTISSSVQPSNSRDRMTPLELLRPLWGLTVTGWSAKEVVFSNASENCLEATSTRRSPECCFATSSGSPAPLFFSALWMEKQLREAKRVAGELITRNRGQFTGGACLSKTAADTSGRRLFPSGTFVPSRGMGEGG